MQRREHNEQVLIFKWAGMQGNVYPELELLFAIPNASYGSSKRDIIRGMYFKSEGRKSGVPDICLPVPKGKYHALYIELKASKGSKIRPTQKKWLEALKKAGNYTKICYGSEDAIKTIKDYLTQQFKLL